MKLKTYFVWDVESIGLHGEGFAAGGVVINEFGEELDSFCFACDPIKAYGYPDDRKWCTENIPSIPITHAYSAEVRKALWKKWIEWKLKDTIMVADCPWPVESRFLCSCVDSDADDRKWKGPYPFLDVASIAFAAGRDPLATVERLPSELPIHNPLADARQSARILIECLNEIGAALHRPSCNL